MKTAKRFLSVTLAMLLLLSAFAVTSSAEDDEPILITPSLVPVDTVPGVTLEAGDVAFAITYNAADIALLSAFIDGSFAISEDYFIPDFFSIQTAEKDADGSPLLAAYLNWDKDAGAFVYDVDASTGFTSLTVQPVASDLMTTNVLMYFVLKGLANGNYECFSFAEPADWYDFNDLRNYLWEDCNADFMIGSEDVTPFTVSDGADPDPDDIEDLLKKVIPLKPLWTLSSWIPFENAYAAAWVVLADPDATEQELLDAYNNLAEAIENLELSWNPMHRILYYLLSVLISLLGDWVYDLMFPPFATLPV